MKTEIIAAIAALTAAFIGFLGTILGVAISGVISWFIARKEQTNRFRLAALDKRLEKHQEAYALWIRLLTNLFNENELNAVVIECQNWYDNNCLFLDGASRTAFKQAYVLAHGHKHYNQSMQEESYNKILTAGRLLEIGVDLPSIGYDPKDRITQ